MAALGRMAFALIVGSVAGLWHALVLQHLWAWFAVPAGASPVGYWNSYGLTVCLSFAAMWALRFREDEPEESLSFQLALVFGRLFCGAMLLGVGAAVHAFAGAS